MVCTRCGEHISSFHNYGSDNQPFCYDCKIIYDREQEEMEQQRLEHERLERIKLEEERFEREHFTGEARPQEQYCRFHPTVPAITVCRVCGAGLCLSCGSDDLNQKNVCASCRGNTTDEPVESAVEIEVPVVNAFCFNHPEIPAVKRCSHCGTPICKTCCFSFPGDVHLCPECVQKKPSELNPKIKRNTIIAFCTAIGSFLSLIVAVVLLADVEENEAILALAGYAMILFTLVPAITGCSLGLSAMPKKGKKPISLLIATWGNIGMIVIFVLLMILGNLSG